LPAAEVSFNYLGQFDQTRSSSMLAGPSDLFAGSVHDPQGKRTHLLEINCQVSANQLRMAWSYSQQVHQHSTIQRVALAFVHTLRSIIDHCQSLEDAEYIPSDFPLAALDQARLNQLVQLFRSR